MSALGGFGVFRLEVGECKSLPDPHGSFCMEFIFAGRTKRTRIIDEPDPDFQEYIEFPVIAKDGELQVTLVAADGNKQLGDIRIPVGAQDSDEPTEEWFSFSNGGQVLLQWIYQYSTNQPASDYSWGTLTVEVAKAQRLPKVSDYEDTVDSLVVVSFVSRLCKTKVKPKTLEPFWNEKFDFEVFDDSDQACLEVQTQDGISLGKTIIKPPSYTANFKGGDWSPLERNGIDFLPGEGPELFIRLQFKAKKRKVPPRKRNCHEEDIEIKRKPKVNGVVGVLPETRLYIWYELLENHNFGPGFVETLLNTFTKKVKGKEVSYDSVDSIVSEHWNVKTRLRLFMKLRSAACQYERDGTVAISLEDEQREWYQWKEFSIMREELSKSYKVKGTLASAFNVVMYGKEKPSMGDKATEDVRMDKKAHATICSHVYCALVPTLSKSLARKIAAEDWEAFDGQHAKHAEEDFLFLRLLTSWACFWCETITEFEFQTFVGSLLPALMRGRREWIGKA
uniref:C2 domain-containing protein n=1 Tax=Eutreptiella gymnastica TaxID=73025 RepID=A0A7S1J6Q4_9EUGL|mmetsp:Transcript_72375/g.127597  ORF Transcript_72375/g.127597 Transcript_72375/m.127597 type:complete len:507 (+) Transcript_72375:100-1620(+)